MGIETELEYLGLHAFQDHLYLLQDGLLLVKEVQFYETESLVKSKELNYGLVH